jgi:RNA polymerase sigma factor (sigma-70 family)
MPPGLPRLDLSHFKPGPRSAKKVKIPSHLHFTMDLATVSNRDLLEHCLCSNDEAGWNEFLRRIIPTISGVVYNKVSRWGRPDPGLVQDLVHDTLLKLFDKEKAALRHFEPQHEDAIFGYVKVIARHVVDDYRHPREESLEEGGNTIEDAKSSEAELFLKVQCAEIERCVEKLDATQMEKDIFWFFYRSRYTAKAIAEMPGVNLSVKRVETILARMIRQVKAEMKRGKGSATSNG